MNYVITVNLTAPRYLHTVHVLQSFNLTVHPILTSYGERVYLRRANLIYGHMNALQRIIASEQKWGRVFEDDIELQKGSEHLYDAFKFFNGSVLYGLCDPVLKRPHMYVGLCTHAYALTADDAHLFLKELIKHNNQTGPDRSFRKVMNRLRGLPVIGAELVSPENVHHIGLFYQRRSKFPGTIGYGSG